MHNTQDRQEETAFVRLYLDESGDDSPNTPHAVVAGILTNKHGFDRFEEEWANVLKTHGIRDPIHMKEFGPHGRFAGVTPDRRHHLFVDLARVVDQYRLFTLSAWLSNQEFKAEFPEQARKAFGVYGMCFNLAVMTAHKKAEADGYKEPISFILDSGNPYKHHIVGAYGSMQKMQSEKFLHVGSLTFEDDGNMGILQGADLIAWAVRRRLAGLAFGYSFEPIRRIFQANHIESSWNSDWLKTLWNGLAKQIDAEKTQGKSEITKASS